MYLTFIASKVATCYMTLRNEKRFEWEFKKDTILYIFSIRLYSLLYCSFKTPTDSEKSEIRGHIRSKHNIKVKDTWFQFLSGERYCMKNNTRKPGLSKILITVILSFSSQLQEGSLHMLPSGRFIGGSIPSTNTPN